MLAWETILKVHVSLVKDGTMLLVSSSMTCKQITDFKYKNDIIVASRLDVSKKTLAKMLAASLNGSAGLANIK